MRPGGVPEGSPLRPGEGFGVQLLHNGDAQPPSATLPVPEVGERPAAAVLPRPTHRPPAVNEKPGTPVPGTFFGLLGSATMCRNDGENGEFSGHQVSGCGKK